ncbi:hypothetical protein CDAR_438771 [Caerostris darwini]|uniref:Uncharacterized protein n=1 Tax=Caerostris darwini TaxID=1538125 RepID=A0AAV4X1T4_9ARAC|nr:hypothetical protein CDAR_438771 [Caerostris darwini]
MHTPTGVPRRVSAILTLPGKKRSQCLWMTCGRCGRIIRKVKNVFETVETCCCKSITASRLLFESDTRGGGESGKDRCWEDVRISSRAS